MNMQRPKAPSLFPRRLLPLMSVVFALFLAPDSILANYSVVSTKHNLSTSGPGPIKSESEEQVCIFCHTPHHANTDIDTTHLWSRDLNTDVYDLYGSKTMTAAPLQPRGYSRLCLSCHDGTIALGVLHGGRTISVSGTGLADGKLTAANRGFLGEDLSDDHPISFDYTLALANSNGELKPPANLDPRIKLEGGTSLECTSCHNPHSDPYGGKFLAVSNLRSGLCTACHDKTGWNSNSHATSEKTWNGSGTDPWPSSTDLTVEENGCGNCHRPHTAQGQHLLNAVEESNCLVCHSGNVAAKNIAEEVDNKTYRHPVSDILDSGVHDAAEDYSGIVEKHVECVDCHNPHQVNDSIKSAPLVPGRLAGVTGVMIDGTVINPAVNEYEVCFKCHGALANNVRRDDAIPRVETQADNSVKFATTNPSYHPVLGPRNSGRSTLLPPWISSSVLYCTDCHNNDTIGGPTGPHGSNNKHILVRKFETSETPAASYNVADYALCFGCHDQNTLFGTTTKFKQHKTHVEMHTKKDRCVYCHDPHGSTQNPGLINFDLRPGIVTSNGGRPIVYKYNDSEIKKTSCVLVCHGTVHGS